MSDVTALMIGGAGLEPVEAVAQVADVASLAELAAAAAQASTPLLWLLDAGAEPLEGALAALLEHVDGAAASLPVDTGGGPIVSLLGRFTEGDAAGLVEAAWSHRVPLRHIPVTSLLIERDLVVSTPPPDPAWFGPYAGAEWTARIFTARRGMLVPTSRVHVPHPPRPSLPHALRMVRSGAWRRGESLRELRRAVVDRAP